MDGNLPPVLVIHALLLLQDGKTLYEKIQKDRRWRLGTSMYSTEQSVYITKGSVLKTVA